MDLDRGTLARIDRKLLAGLGQDETFQMVRVPVTPAQWSIWKRYCDAAGVSMGRAITSLIEHEQLGVFGEFTGDDVPILAGRVEERLTAREADVDVRESAVKAAEERLRRQTKRLRHREDRLAAREHLAQLASKLAHSRKPQRRSAVTSHAHVAQVPNTSVSMGAESVKRIPGLGMCIEHLSGW